MTSWVLGLRRYDRRRSLREAEIECRGGRLWVRRRYRPAFLRRWHRARPGRSTMRAYEEDAIRPLIRARARVLR